MKNIIIIIGAVVIFGLVYFFVTGQGTEIILPSDYSDNYIVLVLNHEGSESLSLGFGKRKLKFDRNGLFMTSSKTIDIKKVIFRNEIGIPVWDKDDIGTMINDLNCFVTNNDDPDRRVKAITWYKKNAIPTDSLGNFNLDKLSKVCFK